MDVDDQYDDDEDEPERTEALKKVKNQILE